MRKRIMNLSLLAAAVISPAVALAHSFPLLVLLVVGLAVVISPAIPLSDATTLEWLSRRGGSYGAVRVYGSIGFLLGAVIAGPFLGGDRITLVFPLYGLFLGATFLASLSAPPQLAAGIEHHSFGVRQVLRDRVA